MATNSTPWTNQLIIYVQQGPRGYCIALDSLEQYSQSHSSNRNHKRALHLLADWARDRFGKPYQRNRTLITIGPSPTPSSNFHPMWDAQLLKEPFASFHGALVPTKLMPPLSSTTR